MTLGMLGTSACGTTAPQEAVESQPPAADGALVPVASVEDIMISLVDPNADVLWNSVYTSSTVDGIEEIYPRTPEDWEKVRKGLVILSEGANLLQVHGRRVAAHDVSEYPGIELTPQEIQALVDKDWATFSALAAGVKVVSEAGLKAVEAQDVAALEAAAGQLDSACEACHMRFWYPNAPPPPGP
jgi:hypothetical protein